jgi:hypothetical protein
MREEIEKSPSQSPAKVVDLRFPPTYLQQSCAQNLLSLPGWFGHCGEDSVDVGWEGHIRSRNGPRELANKRATLELGDGQSGERRPKTTRFWCPSLNLRLGGYELEYNIVTR